MFLHRISWDVARRQGSGCGVTLGGPIPRKVGMWGAGKHTTFSCREGGRAERGEFRGPYLQAPSCCCCCCCCCSFFFFFFSFSFCPNLLERVPRSILKGQAMEGQGLWLQTSGCRNSLSLATVHHVGQVMRFLCCSHAFRETDSLRRTMQIVKCSLLRRRAQGRVSS